jgi:mannosyltransferase OCH1-like enzyme
MNPIIILIVLIIIIILILLIYIQKKTTDNNFFINGALNYKKMFENKGINIPLNIYQTWTTLNLPSKMKETVDELKNTNPEFKHYLYDDKMCRDFIKENFNKDVLYAFDKLKPGAYKADLFRYCILYKNGGVYLDIKYKCVNNFKLIYLMDKEYYVRDRMRDNRFGIYQALLICYPYNNILLNCIQSIINNVKNNYYILDDSGDLMITGPFLMNKYFSKDEMDKFELNIGPINNNIYYNNISILESYKEYRLEQKTSSSIHYSKLYKEIDIYNYYNLISNKNYKYNYQSCNIINNINNYIVIAENNKSIYNFELDKQFNKISNDNIIKNNNIYDIKLFNHKNNIYYIGHIYDNNEIVNTSCNIYNSNEIIPNIIEPDFNNMTNEKNWCLFNYNDNLAVVYNWYPLNICKMDIDNKKITNIKYNYKLPEIFNNINNSSNGYKSNNQIWFVLQLHQKNDVYENYQHFFAIFDLEMNLTKYSELFKLENTNIEKCNGIVIEDDNIILSYTIESNSYISIYNINNNIMWYENDNEFSILI